MATPSCTETKRSGSPAPQVAQKRSGGPTPKKFFKTRFFVNAAFKNLKVQVETEKVKASFKPREIIQKEDENVLDSIKEYIKLWPERYSLRFQKWYVNRQQKAHPDMKQRTFTEWAVVYPEDVFHHLRNWDSGLKKALIKNTLIDNTRKLVNRIYYKEKRFNQRSAQHGQHPHENEQLKHENSTLTYKGFKEYPKLFITGPKPVVHAPQETNVTDLMQEQSGETGISANDLEMTSSIQSTSNITFVDERPIDTTQLHTRSTVFSNDKSKDIAESPWTLESVLTREYPVLSFNWKATETVDNIIVEEGIPQIITKSENCLITRQLKFFSYLRAGVKIRVQLNGTKFHCGRLIVYFVPLTWKDDTEVDFYGITAFPHFFLDASISNSGEMSIPFTHLLTYFSQESGTLWKDNSNALGRLIVRPYNNLRASDTASQTLYGEIYCSLIDPVVHLPTYEIKKFSYGTGYLQGLEALMKKGAGTLINSGLGLADKFTGGLVTGAGDMLSNLLGVCDKPLDPVSAAPIVNRTVAPLCHGAGLDRSTRLALSPTSQTSTDPSILGSVDADFNLLTLCKIPTLLQQVEWKSADAPGTKLWDMLVTPVYLSNPQYQRDEPSKVANYNPTMLAYISRAFCLWRGSLKVKIQVVATQFHSGRLALIYDPHGSARNNITDFEKNKNHNMIVMDIQEQQELVVELPYFAVRPWMRCDKFRADANLTAMSDIVNDSYLDCDVTGVFRIFVLNNLVKPTNVVDAIQINVFFYAGDNFELSVPNPVAPLSVRKTGKTSFANSPRYPWCKAKATQICDYEYPIYNLYLAGLRLYRQGFITSTVAWDNFSVTVWNNDTTRFKNSMMKFDAFKIDADAKCLAYIKALPKYSDAPPDIELMEEQGVESYTTTRENEGTAVTITDKNMTSQVAPKTISEDAMNLQTLLRRYYPLYVSPTLKNSDNFTIISIPVSPAFVPDGTTEGIQTGLDRRVDLHNLAWFARLYTYWRGSMRYKIVVNTAYSDIYVWHNPVDTKTFHISTGFDYDHVADQLNFASDVAVTQVQQGLEVEVPFYSGFNQLVHSHVKAYEDLRANNGVLYVAVRNTSAPLNVSIFISTGDDFFLNVLRSPPTLHEPFKHAYTDGSEGSAYPELQAGLHHGCSSVQIPGTYVFDRWYIGAFANCNIVPAPPLLKQEDFSSNKLDINSQQMMEEQMFSSIAGVPKTLENVNKLTEEISPLIPEFKETLSQFKILSTDLNESILPQVLGHAKTFHQDLNNTHDTVKGFLPKIEEALSFTNAASKGIEIASEYVKDAAESVEYCGNLLGNFMRIIHITGVYLNIQEMLKQFKWINLLNVITNTCAIFRVETTKIIKWLWQYIQTMYEDYRSKVTYGAMIMDEQGCLEDFVAEHHEETVLGLAAIATILYCSLFGNLPSFGRIKEIIRKTVEEGEIAEEQGLAENLRKIHYSNLGIKAIGTSFEFFKTWVEKLISWFLGVETPELLILKDFQDTTQKIQQWIKTISDLEDEDFYHLALTDIDIHNTFYKLADEGIQYTNWLIDTPTVPPSIAIVVRDTNRRLGEMIKRINEIRPGHGYRYAPFVVCFHGETSTGKSEMMHHITKMFRENLKCPIYNSVYAVPSNDKYLSGYEGQPIVEWDDMLQNTEQDSMVAEFVQWCSNADTKINMADLAHKGTHFTSKAIICTTNCAYVNVNTIRDMEAFQRRRNVVVGVQFAQGHNKDTMMTAEHDPNFSHAIFAILENTNSRHVIQGNMTWLEVIDYVNEKHKAWDLKQQRKLKLYFTSNPSMRIPRGIVIEEEEEENYVDAEEQGLVVKCSINKDGLSEEEEIDAELFQLEFENLEQGQRLSLMEQFQIKLNKVRKNIKTNRYFELLTRKLELGKQRFLEIVNNYYAKYPGLCKALVMISSFVATVSVMMLLKPYFASLFGFSVEEAYDQNVKTSKNLIVAEHYQETVKINKPLMRAEHYDTVTKVKPNIIRAEAREEGSSDPEAVKLARNKIHPLLTLVGWESGLQLQGISCFGKVLLVPHHFFRRAEAGQMFWFLRGNDKVQVEFVPEHMFRIRDKDACLYYMGARYDSRKSIINNFVEEKFLTKISSGVEAILVGTNDRGIIMEKAGRAIGNTTMSYQGKDDQAPIYKQFGWSYKFHTVKGECGSMLVATSKVLPPPAKIIGMHVAGYADKTGGFSILLTREMIQETLEEMNNLLGPQVLGASLPPQVIQDEQAFEENARVVPEGHFSLYGLMDKKFCPSQPLKTKLCKTPFYEELYPATKQPAMLRPTEGLSPLKLALGKYGKQTIPFKHQHVKIVSNSILNDLKMLNSELGIEPVDLKVAIFGEAGVDYVNKMNMKSSPGWPYQCLSNSRGQEGKRYLFDEEKQEIKDPLLKQNLEIREQMAKRGERFPSIWRDCLKDELRPIEKVQQGKTRLFTIAPCDYTILVRKYFMPFVQAFYAGYSTFFSAVGINAESYDWTMAYNRLRKYGNKCIAGDFSTFDGTLMSELMFEVGEIINKWFAFHGDKNQENHLVRKVLIDEMIHTYQLVQNCVYKTHQGNPSGNPLTVIINTIVNAFYMRLSWIEIMLEQAPALATMDAYEENVIEEMYGDDNRLVVKESVLQLFNQLTITKCLKQHGIGYTDEEKSESMLPFKLLEETSFLKRKYRKDPDIGDDIQLPVMNLETITSLTNWYRSGNSLKEQLIANQRAALGFAFFYGRQFFEEFYNNFSVKLIENEIKPVNLSYDELLIIFQKDIREDGTAFIDLMNLDFSGRKGRKDDLSFTDNYN